MCEPVIYHNKDRVLVLTEYRILLYSPDDILAQEQDLKGTQINLGDRTVKVSFKDLVALSVWPIRTFKEKQREVNEIVLYFAERCEPVSKSLQFESPEKMIAFSDKIYTALENIKGELTLRKFKKDHPNESTIEAICRQMVDFLNLCFGGSMLNEKQIRESITYELTQNMGKYDKSKEVIDQQMIETIQSRVASHLKKTKLKNMNIQYEEYSEEDHPLKSDRYAQ